MLSMTLRLGQHYIWRRCHELCNFSWSLLQPVCTKWINCLPSRRNSALYPSSSSSVWKNSTKSNEYHEQGKFEKKDCLRSKIWKKSTNVTWCTKMELSAQCIAMHTVRQLLKYPIYISKWYKFTWTVDVYLSTSFNNQLTKK